MGIYTESEMQSHFEIKLEKYCQVLNIEVSTMLQMVNKDIIPAAFKYMNVIADTEFKMQRVFTLCDAGLNLIKKLNDLINELDINSEKLNSLHDEVKAKTDILEKSQLYASIIIPQMQKVRQVADSIEKLLGSDYKPFPSYEDLLFSVQ